MRVVVITPPEPVVSRAEAKLHLKVEHDDDDTLIDGMIAAATGHVDGPEGWLGRALGVQTLEAYLPAFGVVAIGLPYPPAIEIVEIAYVDERGEQTIVEPTVYDLRGNMLRARWQALWPRSAWQGADGETVRIRYRAGYQAIPPAVRTAILLMVGDLYRNRDTVAALGAVAIPMSMTVKSLLGPLRVWG